MTKKLFLAAASVAVLAVAGAATAGEISGSLGTGLAAVNFDDATTYKVANERTVSASAAISGNIVATNALALPISVGAGAQRDHLVTFTVTGATVTSPTLTAVNDNDPVGNVTSSLISNNNGEVVFLVTVADGAEVSALSLNADIEQKAKASITVANKVVAVIGATNITVDTAPAVTAVEYAPLFKSVSVDAADVYTWEADLPNYDTLDNSASQDLAENFVVVNAGDFYQDLAGDTVVAADVLDGAAITVRGPIIDENIEVSLGGLGTAGTAPEANSALFELDAADAATFADGASTLSIANATGDGAFRLGTYRLTWAPVAKANFTVPSSSSVDAGSVTLEGTNFTAPWVSGTGAATSVIRISNSNSVASGAVTVRLMNAVKVVGGVATPVTSTAVYNAGTVPAGADLQITSSQLVGAFGEFTRGDVQVTINSSTAGFTAKMRNTRDGATFEQSLGN